jgi:hypothetical protein
VPDAAELLAREARSLVERLRLWTPQRWTASPGDTAPTFGTRADLVHHLASAFVLAAGETTRPLPRLNTDLVLPDQLAVAADDLVRSGRAADVHVAHLLLHRHDLLGEDVPVGIADALRLNNVLETGRQACAASPLGDPSSGLI